MNRRAPLARILMIDGILLLVAAALYFALTGMATRWLTNRLSPAEYSEVAPQFMTNHLAAGILLVPLAVSTLYCAWGVRKGQQWSRIMSAINGISIIAVPVVLAWFMGAQYYGSVMLLLATLFMGIIGITMLVPAVWFPADKPDIQNHADHTEKHPAS